ncbi:MAG: hypothetical protein U0800_22580 [Isosphaeraceae bacterium]
MRARNRLWKWEGLRPASRASAASVGGLGASSRRHARTIASRSGTGPAASSGRHRLHGRKPAALACAVVSKNRTFSRLGNRERQPDRQ